MDKPISKNVHGIIDYSYAAIVPHLPELIGFENQENATTLCRTLGGGALAYTLLTKAKWAPVPLIPFKTHLAIDLSVSLLALATPWLFGFSRHRAARNTLLAVGLTGIAASLLTDSK